MNICCHCHGTFAGLYVSHKRHIIRISAYVTNNGTHGLTENESSREEKFPGHFAPGSESSREREGQGAKVPGSELARVPLADLLREANWPGSEKAVNPNMDNI